jgi:DNA polymerase III delta subunit
MKLKPFRAEKLVEQAHHWTLAELTAALDGLLALDVAIKGADGTATTEAQRRLAFLLWVAERVAPGR